jgi:glyoxylate reductase
MSSIFITRYIAQPAIDQLAAAGHHVVLNPHDRNLSQSELIAYLKGCDGLIPNLVDRIDAPLLDASPLLRAIAQVAVGFNNIDVAACTRRRVGVCNTPDVLTNATAETAWALIYACARRVGEAERSLRAGKWEGWGPRQFLGHDIVGKTLGIIGSGRIGQQVARMSRGLGMPLLYFNRSPNAVMEKELGATRVSLDELLRSSDVISIHTPLTPETRHLIGKTQLAMMKPTAILINTSRGAVIDEAALVEALRENRIFAAGLDVYEEEPKLAPGLMELDNAVLLPHIGSATVETREKMAILAANNMIAMLAGRKPPTPLNPELWS